MNAFGFCNLSIVPCRKETSDKSEMVNQLLFGEYFEVLEEYKSWIRIRSGIDEYEGWIDRKQYLPVSKETYQSLKKQTPSYTADIVSVITDITEDVSFPVTMGCMLPFHKGKEYFIEKKKYAYQGNVVAPTAKIKRAELVEDAF